jgi:L-ascorbate metabolism protein UlaG (beta-lactamase superfamily)
MSRSRRRRSILAALASLLVLGALFLVIDGWKSFGSSARGERLSRMQASPRYRDGVFTNPQPLWNDFKASLSAITDASNYSSPEPSAPPAILRGDGKRFLQPPASGLRVTWLGHSTLLIEIDGQRILTDPIFGERASPYDWVGPKRWYEPPIPLGELPAVDAVLISHDHYDHLQRETIEAIRGWQTTFITPLGVGAHLEYWGVPPERIVELDWWQSRRVGELEIVCSPARHASGRHLFDQNETLWAGYALVGPRHRAFFSGDTGMFPGLKEIGERLGPFDVTMIEVGAYNRAWPDWHIGPEQAVQAQRMLRGKLLLPIHWGLWNLAAHGWTEPAERVLAEAARQQAAVTIPRPGQSIEPSAPPPLERWWPDVPWQTAAEHPIVSTANGQR